ncbi:ABC transporter permease subunit [Paracoccus sp. TK19116]|uniref:ABC transporter permease subunit n=1 Tax=Paracoccus albicereus TaxID=2922394 RepID=A0ABT1MMV2_9RHOB|nr:ABC transporter permease subunit [Paracoccus albicereus]MCQ0969610.1 ABC transporter permease subunit [Paracoccus albicereus]
MKVMGYELPLMSSLIVWAILWEILGQMDVSILLPPLSAVLVKMVEIIPTQAFLSALAVTARGFLTGTILAALIGVPLGILMGKSIIVDRMLLPWVNMFLSAPLSALVPVLMVLFGIGEQTVIITTLLFAVWIIMLNARAGVMQISPSLVEMARSFGATPWQAFREIYFWAALPEIIAGVRIGLLRAVKGVIIGQLLVSIIGFGRLFELYSTNFLMPHFWAILLVLFFFAFLFAEIFAVLERRVRYYASNRT